ncbi:hypothetical protein TMatcc_008469 [Talaromyces marneffei ATCC 18224]|uniref:DUF1275 domain protein n=2 Tax=Talaromyces marneffei TaxID=37727 RepID=B6QLX7_TALMQ|nr:uncharacterized protein EYB26_007805 [Talaromyces marneffei]EEA22104.1 conserved hypothetical protein [Talaromyces marneffei ATCC 18224]KAE8550438.1 hypothetical protein EYB25_006664 [Talaromyces marneffei]QGA20105.1 hypothetical protein EYB26_007805 [Talaromyces marneffei]
MAQPRETDPLLPHDTGNSHDNNNAIQRLRRHLNNPVSTHHTDLILLYCYIITGLLDSSAVFIWGSFVSMQTGNTVYLGLGLASQASHPKKSGAGSGSGNDDRWIKSGISIISFCLGSLIFGAFHRAFSPRKRWVLMASSALQMICITCAATIVTMERPSKDSALTWRVIVPLAMVAFQSSGQAVISRVLKLGGLSSVVLTSVYCDLFSHPDFLSGVAFRKDVEERRRAGAVVCLLAGAVMGGFWARSEVGLMGALWTAVGLKAVIVLAWCFWRRGDRGDVEVQA